MSHVTTDIDEEPVTMVAYNFGVEDIHLLSGHELADPNVYIVFVNGKFFVFLLHMYFSYHIRITFPWNLVLLYNFDPFSVIIY